MKKGKGIGFFGFDGSTSVGASHTRHDKDDMDSFYKYGDIDGSLICGSIILAIIIIATIIGNVIR